MSGSKAIVIGGSSGIGAEIVRQLAAAGWSVAVVARRNDRLSALARENPDRIRSYVHDVTNLNEPSVLLPAIAHDLGGLDMVVYAAGVMPAIGASEFNTHKDRTIIETNLLGAMAWLNEAASRFEKTGHGTIVAIGSVAGDRGRSGQPAYNTSKAALATYMEALRNRIGRQGVRVTTIKPGPVDTEMTARLGLRGAMSAPEAARRVLILAHRGGEHYLSAKHRLIFYILKRIPSPVFRRLKI